MNVQTNTIDMHWKRRANDGPADTVFRKLAQAEALASMLYGETGKEFRAMNDVIQDNTMWLVADLLTEIREAYEAREEEISEGYGAKS